MTNILTNKDIDDLENYLKNLSDDDKYSQISSINEINIKNEELINHEKEVINNEKELIIHKQEVIIHKQEVINRNQELINYNQELINHKQELINRNKELINYNQELINPNQEFQKDKIINYVMSGNDEYSNYLENLINANNRIIKQTDNFFYKENVVIHCNIPEKNKINCKNKFKSEMINNILNGIKNLESMIYNFKK
jgi:hypothetical protein